MPAPMVCRRMQAHNSRNGYITQRFLSFHSLELSISVFDLQNRLAVMRLAYGAILVFVPQFYAKVCV
jgi:hypothetical protein